MTVRGLCVAGVFLPTRGAYHGPCSRVVRGIATGYQPVTSPITALTRGEERFLVCHALPTPGHL